MVLVIALGRMKLVMIVHWGSSRCMLIMCLMDSLDFQVCWFYHISTCALPLINKYIYIMFWLHLVAGNTVPSHICKFILLGQLVFSLED